MNIEIYYFSGSGNSLAIARGIAEAIKAKMISIPSVMAQRSLAPAAEALGVVFPVYHGSIPLIVKRFTEKLERLDGKYIFAVCTYGDSPGLAIHHLETLVQARGGALAAGFAVHMPYNYITPGEGLKDFFSSFSLREIPIEKQQALFAEAQQKIEFIAAYIAARKTGVFETHADFKTRLVETFGIKDALGKYFWLKIAGVNERTELPFLESRQLMDCGFHYDEQCNGCGICVRLCPVDNINMVDDRPRWQRRCEQCFACLQWCPQEAIQFGLHTTHQKRYHHPAVKMADMLKP